MDKQSQQRAAQILSRAFFNDPSIVWILPDAKRRQRQLEALFSASVRYGDRYGHIDTTPNHLHGLAVWLKPGESSPSPLHLLQVGFVPLLLQLGLRNAQRLLRCVDFMDRYQRNLMPQPHWYLFLLGIDPPRQSQGFGSALMLPILEQADQQGLPCYLETYLESDVRWYTRLKFRVLSESRVPGSGPPIWMMSRPPQ